MHIHSLLCDWSGALHLSPFTRHNSWALTWCNFSVSVHSHLDAANSSRKTILCYNMPAFQRNHNAGVTTALIQPNQHRPAGSNASSQAHICAGNQRHLWPWHYAVMSPMVTAPPLLYRYMHTCTCHCLADCSNPNASIQNCTVVRMSQRTGQHDMTQQSSLLQQLMLLLGLTVT